MGKLDGKVALITGGARGQGAAEGRRFAAEGAVVYLTDVLADDGAKTAADAIGATFLDPRRDPTREWAAVVDRVVADHGRLDVLVNNAGILHWATMTKTAARRVEPDRRGQPDRRVPRHAGGRPAR